MGNGYPYTAALENEGVTLEFEGQIDGEGKIAVPERLREQIPGSGTIHVHLTSHPLSAHLKKRNIQETEILRIENLQLESREQVIRFLLSEGALKSQRGKSRGLKAKSGSR